jgi:hypothetical protein
MSVEAAVLAHEDRLNEGFGNAFERHPLLRPILAPLPHQRGLSGVLALQEVDVGKGGQDPGDVSAGENDEREKAECDDFLASLEPTVW